MTLLLLSLLAQADPARPLARTDEALTERTWWTVEDVDTGPARPQWRNRRGAWQCWTFPDGVAARCIQREGKQILMDRRFDAAGVPLTTLVWEGGEPHHVTVHGPTPLLVPLQDSTTSVLGSLQLRGPGAVTVDPNGRASWTTEHGTLSAELAAKGDPFASGFIDLLRAECACVIEDRASTWLQDRPAVRYRVRVPDPDAPSLTELWLVPDGERTVVIRFATDAAGPLAELQARLDHGRAWVSLAEPAPPQEAP